MSETKQVILFLACLCVIAIAFSFYISIKSNSVRDVCHKAGYDGYKSIERQLFCYRVQDNGQIEYLRYEFASQ